MPLKQQLFYLSHPNTEHVNVKCTLYIRMSVEKDTSHFIDTDVEKLR